jgi:hypothetical protein
VEVAQMMDWLRARPWWFWGGVGVVVVLGAYAFGRWSAPTKTEVVFQTVTEFRDIEKKVIEKGPVRYKKVVVETPGKERVTTVTVEKDPVTITVDREVEKKTTEYVRETVERDRARVAIFGTVGVPFNAGGVQPLQFGLAATATVLGPVSVIVAGSGGATGGQVTGGVGLAW